MGIIWVDVIVVVDERFVTMFRNVKLEVEEECNREMNQAFEEQHPKLLAKIPSWKNSRGFTFKCAFECKVIREKGDW